MKKIISYLLLLMSLIISCDISDAANYINENITTSKGSISIISADEDKEDKEEKKDYIKPDSKKYLPKTNDLSNKSLEIYGFLIILLVIYLLIYIKYMRRDKT